MHYKHPRNGVLIKTICVVCISLVQLSFHLALVGFLQKKFFNVNLTLKIRLSEA